MVRGATDFTFLHDSTNFKVFKTHSFVPQNNLMSRSGQVILSFLHGSEKQDLEKLKDFSEIIELVSGRV